jgi:hypothetical protein
MGEISKSLILRLAHHAGLFPEGTVPAGAARMVLRGHETSKPASSRVAAEDSAVVPLMAATGVLGM